MAQSAEPGHPIHVYVAAAIYQHHKIHVAVNNYKRPEKLK